MVIVGCEVSGPVPAYVRVEKFDLTTTPSQGTDSEKITEGWFFADGEFLGAYTLPADIPVIADGLTTIRVNPGIKVNGIISTPDIYDFYERHVVDLDLTPGVTETISPTTQYTDFSVFAFLEDFETSNAFVDDLDGNDQTRVETVGPDEAFEGARSGYIRLTEENSLIEVASLPVLTTIPTNGSDVFLELNYKNNVEFALGLTGSAPGLPQTSAVVIVLRPQEDWNKLYLELGPTLLASRLPGYQIFITALHSPVNEESEIYFDNFKLIYVDQ